MGKAFSWGRRWVQSGAKDVVEVAGDVIQNPNDEIRMTNQTQNSKFETKAGHLFRVLIIRI
jgi:hypothetical protein